MPPKYTHAYTYTHTHPLTHPSTHSLIHSLTNSPIHSPAHPLTHPLLQSQDGSLQRVYAEEVEGAGDGKKGKGSLTLSDAFVAFANNRSCALPRTAGALRLVGWLSE